MNGSAKSWGLEKEDGNGSEVSVPDGHLNSSHATAQGSRMHTSGLPYIHDDSMKIDGEDPNVDKAGVEGKWTSKGGGEKIRGEGGRGARRGDAEHVQKQPVLSPQSPPGCKIYVWDVGRDVAPKLGMPVCNITDVWPFDHPGSGIAGMRRTSHMDAPHAAGYWLSNAVKTSPYYESNIDKADLILLDTYVLSHIDMWYFEY